MFASVVGIFLLLAGMFLVFQYQRETEYKIDILNNRLQVINLSLALPSKDGNMIDSLVAGKANYKHSTLSDVRLSIFDLEGNSLYDNESNVEEMDNHLNRREIRQALEKGSGYDIQRNSESLDGEQFFYSATLLKDRGVIVRSALHYNSQLYKDLTIDKTFVIFIIGITIVLCIILYQIAHRLALTESEKVENEKQQLKRQLTQNAAHELKTPTASISAYLETLLEDNGTLSEEKRHQFLERSFAQCKRMTNILSDMSALAKMDAIQQVKEPMLINIRELLDEIKDGVSHALEENNMTLTINVENLLVLGDRSLVYSIFRNLIDNAIAYAGEGKTIQITASRANSETAEFFVSDNGIGVQPIHIPHLCERFYRIDKGRSRKLGGTGLGLAIVKNAVLLHGGEINLFPTPNGGLTVRFTLPSNI